MPTSRPSSATPARTASSRRGGRLAGRGGQAHERWPPAGGRGLGGQQRQHLGHRGRLARPGAARDDRDLLEHCGGGSQALLVVAPAEPRAQAVGQHGTVDSGCRRLGPAAEVGGDQLLVRPQSVEVEGRALEVQGPVRADERAGGQTRRPGRGLGPGQAGQVGWPVRVGVRRLVDGGQVDADVAQPRRTGGEGGPQLGRIVARAAQPGQAARHLDVGHGQHARFVERAQDALGAERRPGVEGVRVLVTVHSRTTPRSKRSLNAPTRATGGRHDQTPQGTPSTRSSTRALMPRTNRYRTPPRCRSGS